MINLKDRLSELDVLLNYVEPEEWLKIPDYVIFYIKENKNKEYKWEYDETKSLEDQNINRDTFSLLTFIMYKFVASEEEKKEISLLVDEVTEDLKQKYDAKKIFKKTNEENVMISNETALVKIDEKNQTFFRSIISFIKKFLKKQ